MNVCFAPRPVVFDLDGTLIDSAPDIHACVNSALTEHGRQALSLDRVRGFIGGGVDVLWNKISTACQIDEASRKEMQAAFMGHYLSATEHTVMFDGVAEALNILADRGHPLGICTNKPLGPTRTVLKHFGLDHLFAVVVAGDTQPEKKPHPAPLRAAFSALGADPDKPQAIFVGDSEFDAECAAALPVPFLLYEKGYRQTPPGELIHRASFESFAELPGLVEAEAQV